MRISRRDLRRRLFQLAATQGGYFTAAQARQLGYSYQAQAHHVHAGNWLRVDRGLFRFTDWVPEVHDDLIRWSLWSDGRGVISHETALTVHGIGELESARVHLTAPTRFAKRDDAVAVHTGVLPPEDVTEHTGFRVTTPVRSLVDVAPTVEADQLARAIDDARDAGLLTARQLRERAEAVDAKAALHVERALQRSTAS